MRSRFADGLVSAGPAAEYREELMLYGQFVGDWRAEATGWAPNGAVRKSTWNIPFQWVLERRAIQDLWNTPAGDRGSVGWHHQGNRYSTTLRMYQPRLKTWRIVWVNPPSGMIVTQTGSKVGEIEPDGSISRWVYRDITPASFQWCNDNSQDRGASWNLIQQMLARRQ